jgi:hypothetical protein
VKRHCKAFPDLRRVVKKHNSRIHALPNILFGSAGPRIPDMALEGFRSSTRNPLDKSSVAQSLDVNV